MFSYDYSVYAKNIRELKRNHRKNKIKLSSNEFLSGIQKTDRLLPVMTIVLYTGRECWDAPLSLHEMLVPIPEYMKPFIADYKINLLQIQNSEQFLFKNSDVNILFDVARMVFRKQYDKIYEKYQDKPIAKEVVTAIGTITKFSPFVEIEEEQKGEVIMCNFMEEYREYCLTQGIEQGMFNAAELLVGQGKTIEEIAVWLNLPQENIEQYLASKQ